MSYDTPPLPAPPAAPVETSLAARLTNIFITPGEVFTEVKTSPIRHANWLVGALIFVLLSWVAAGVMSSQESIRHQQAEVQEQALQKKFQKQIDAGKMTQAQADQIKASAVEVAGYVAMGIWFLAPLFGAAIGTFLGGFILWAIGTLIFRKTFPYLKAVEATGLTLVVTGLGALVKGLLCAAMGSLFVSPGLVLLVRSFDPANLLHTMLLTFDVFAIWGTALSAIALAKLSEVSLVKAFVWVFGVSFAILGGLVTFGWLMQRLGERLGG